MDAMNFINILKPTHDRTSCDDSKIANGFGTASITISRSKTDDEGVVWHTEKGISFFRCQRCAMWEILFEDYPLSIDQIEYMNAGSYDAVVAAYRFRISKS